MTLALFSPHNMISNSSPAPFVASASSSYFNPFHAFAGSNTAFYWLANSGSICHLKLYTGSIRKVLDTYELRMNVIPEPARAPKDWIVYGSNDDLVWTTLDTVTNQTSWGSGEKRTFECDNKTAAFSYFMIAITANNGDGSYTQIEEWFMYEKLSQKYYWQTHFRGRNRLNLLPISVGIEDT